MPRLVFKTGDSDAQILSLQAGVTTVGRHPANDVTLNDHSISSRHCRIVVQGESVSIIDLESTNGTFIDGKPVKEALLLPGQQLRLGNLDFTLEAAVPHVAIPTLTVDTGPASVILEDGALSCVHHTSVRATVKCNQCSIVFCDACVRTMRRSGGKAMMFCPSCNGPCEAIPDGASQKKNTFLGRLTQTIRLAFRR